MTNMSKHIRTWGDDLPSISTENQNKRRLEMNQILTALKRIPMGEEGDRHYPIRFLRDGIDAYINLFDNAAVYYAALAVELALIVRLGQQGVLKEWREQERKAVKEGKKQQESNYPPQRALIRWAKQEGLLDNKTNELAHKVRKARNSYIHYYNVMWHQIDIDRRTRKKIFEMLPKVREEISRYAQPSERDKLLNMVDSMTDDALKDETLNKREIPTEDIRPNKEAVEFIEERERSFEKQLFGLWDKGEWDKVRRSYDCGIEWHDALDCLRWSVHILAHLEFLEDLDEGI